VIPFPAAKPVPEDPTELADDGVPPANVIRLHDFTPRPGRNRYLDPTTTSPGPAAA
jgi:hypothetical protein